MRFLEDPIRPLRRASRGCTYLTPAPSRLQSSTTLISCRPPDWSPFIALAQHCDLADLADEHLSVPTDKGTNADRKVGSLVAGMVAGADSTAVMAILRHGAMKMLFDRPYAPSTPGSLLCEFTFGHVRPLDRRLTLPAASRRAAPLVAGIDTERVLVDVDDSIIEVHGHGRQGSGYGYPVSAA